MYPCAVRGCRNEIGERDLMCPRHWRMLPAADRSQLCALARGHRRVGRDRLGYLTPAAFRALERVAVEEDRAARKAAQRG
jgi:hypothetical protein